MKISGSEVLCTAKEAAKYLGVCRATFYTLYKGELNPCTIGKQKRAYYRQSDLDRLNVVEPVASAQLAG